MNARVAELDFSPERSKLKDGGRPKHRIAFRGEVVDLGVDEDGDPISSLAFSYDAGAKTAKTRWKEREATDNALKIKAAIKALEAQGGPVSKDALAEMMLNQAPFNTDPNRARMKKELHLWLQGRPRLQDMEGYVTPTGGKRPGPSCYHPKQTET